VNESLATAQKSLERLTEELSRMAALSVEECDTDEVERVLQERQVILNGLQNTDTSGLDAGERQRLIRSLQDALRLDSDGLESFRKQLNVLTKSSSSLTQARRAVSGYRPTVSDDARPLRSIV